jgi:hypothetical protein
LRNLYDGAAGYAFEHALVWGNELTGVDTEDIKVL